MVVNEENMFYIHSEPFLVLFEFRMNSRKIKNDYQLGLNIDPKSKN